MDKTKKRLEGLRAELRLVESMQFLSFDLKDAVMEYYDNEIDAIAEVEQ